MVNCYRNLHTKSNLLGCFFFLVIFLCPIMKSFPRALDADMTSSEPQNSIRVQESLDLCHSINELPEVIFFRSISSKNTLTPKLGLGQIPFSKEIHAEIPFQKNITPGIPHIGRKNIPFYFRKPTPIPNLLSILNHPTERFIFHSRVMEIHSTRRWALTNK